MADQTVRVLLDVVAEGAVEGTNKANKAFGETEKVITRVTDRGRAQIDRMVETWRTKAELAKISVAGGALEMRKLELAAEAVANKLRGDSIAAEKVAASVRTITSAIKETDAAARQAAKLSDIGKGWGQLQDKWAQNNRQSRMDSAALVAEGRKQNKEFADQIKNQEKLGAVAGQTNKSMLSGAMALAGQLGLVIGAGEAVKIFFKDILLGSALYAARVEQLGVAMNAVGRANQVSPYRLRETESMMKTIGMTTAESRMSLSRLMAGGINLTEGPKLARLAQDVGRVAGIPSSDAMERLTHAIITLQPELFRYLGLNISLEQAYKRVAKQQGINTDSLTEVQKRQIAVNEAFRVGAAYTGVYADSLKTAGGQILSMDRYIKEMRLGFGKEFLSELTTVVTLLNQIGKGSEPLGSNLAKWVKASALNLILPGTGTGMFGSKAAAEWLVGKWGRPNPETVLDPFRRGAAGATESAAAFTKAYAEENKAKNWDDYLKRPGLKMLEIRLSVAQKQLQDAIEEKHPIAIDAADKLVDSLEKQIKLMKERLDLAEKMTKAQADLALISSDQLMDSYARSVYLGKGRDGQPIWGPNKQRTQGDVFSNYGIDDIGIRMRELNVGMPTKTGDYDRSDQARYDQNIKATERFEQHVLAYKIRAAELTSGPGGELAAVEKIYQLRMAAGKTQEDYAEAAYDRENRLFELQKRRFDELRSSFEGLFDAAFGGARSFWDAVRRMALSVFLTPVKREMSRWVAEMLTRRGGAGGGGLASAVGASSGLAGMLGAPNYAAENWGPMGPGMGGGFSGLLGGGSASAGGSSGMRSLGGYPIPTGYQALLAGGLTMGGTALAGAGWRRNNSAMTALGGAGMGYGAASMMGFDPIAGAMLGGGLGLAVSGIRNNKPWMGAAGGALAGLMIGGPIGAAIGAAAGGIIAALWKTSEQKVIDKVQQLYGIRIDKPFARQIVDMAKQTYGGNLDMAVRAPQVRELIELYSMATGQAMKGLVAKQMPTTFSQSGGRLTQQANYWNGSVYTPPVQTTGLGGGGPTINVQLDPGATREFLNGRMAQTIVQNPRTVGAAQLESGRQSSGRRELAAQVMQPGLILA